MTSVKARPIRLATVPLAGLLWLAACSKESGTAEPAPANAAPDLGATANELERMANELEAGQR